MREDVNCYGSPKQRDLVKLVAGTPFFSDFFLTGGTCLSVFYLHHRVSHDLDFFTVANLDLAEIAPSINSLLRPERTVAAARHFLSCVADGVKMDFVVDPLSSRERRPVVRVDEVPVTVDSLENIGPNKICALVSRGVPKDLVDCYMLYGQGRYGRDRGLFLRDYRVAREREALLDDLMYVGEKLHFLSETAMQALPEIAPDLRVAISARDLTDFYAGLGDEIFRMGTTGEEMKG